MDGLNAKIVSALLVIFSIAIFIALKSNRSHGDGCLAADMAHARITVFAATAPLWLSLFIYVLWRVGVVPGPITLVIGLVVLYYITLEVQVLSGYSGPWEELEGGSAELPSERSMRLATIAFALGTLLVSQKDAKLAEKVGAVVFVGLLFAVLPSIATGPSAKRKGMMDPYFAAVQRACLTLGAGLIALALALCVSLQLVNPESAASAFDAPIPAACVKS